MILYSIFAQYLDGEFCIQQCLLVISQFGLHGTQVGVGSGQFLQCYEWYGCSFVLMGEIFILEFLCELQMVEAAAVLALPEWLHVYRSYRQARLLKTAICSYETASSCST